jgi:hypothetical protein
VPAAGAVVRAGHEVTAGATAPRTIDPARASLDWALAGRAAVRAHGVPLRVETTPPGASVTLDAEPIGTTPVTVLARPGSAHLAITLADHAPVREEMELVANHPATRKLTLFPLRVRATRAYE